MKRVVIYNQHIGKLNIPQLVSDLQRTAPPFETENFFDEILQIDHKEFSSRVLNHWESKGILISIREGEAGWRKFKVVETFWLNVISELREFDISLDMIKEIKKILIPQTKNEDNDLKLLKNLILCAFCHVPVNLVLLSNDEEIEVGIVTSNWLKELLHPPSQYISVHAINLNKIVQRMYPDEKLNPIDWVERGKAITVEESKILLELRTDEWVECEIKRQNHKSLLITKTIFENEKQKIVNILSKNDYTDITIQKRNGSITRITTKKIKKI